MTISLPAAIAIYFEISNGIETDRLDRCFTVDATVRDEGRTYRGHDAIATWVKETREKIEFSVEPLNVLRDGNRVTVAARVVGNFPGSPIELDHAFQLTGDRIVSLEIG